MVRKSPSSKPWGLRLYYSSDYLGSVGVHLSAPVRNWLESLPGFIGLEAQTLTLSWERQQGGSELVEVNDNRDERLDT